VRFDDADELQAAVEAARRAGASESWLLGAVLVVAQTRDPKFRAAAIRSLRSYSSAPSSSSG
jgi:hypothetical protein